jgi:hypothetical protein
MMKKFWSENWWKILFLFTFILIDTKIWHPIVENYFKIHKSMTDFVSSIIGAIIAGLITWAAMWFIDYQNKKRWQKNSMQEYKNTKIIGSIRRLADCLNFMNIENGRLKNLQ